MRAVPYKQLRRIAPLATLDVASAAVGSAAEISWEQFLNQNPQDASALRTGLWAVGFMKCWYSEAPLQQSEGHIEHFRPKGRLSGASHGGYIWRTFDWQNLRLAHATVNQRRTDFLKKRKMGKGSYFPLRDPAVRATNANEEANEEPTLLDPIIPSETLLITFDEPSGAPRARFKSEQNEWLHRRAKESIDYYHLDESSWNARRADLMASVQKLCIQLEELAIKQPRDDAEYNLKIDEIVTYINPFAEFSSACLQIVRNRGLLEHFVQGLA